MYKFRCRYVFLIPLGIYSGVELLGLSLERQAKSTVGTSEEGGEGDTESGRGEEVGAGEEQFSSGSLTFSVGTP